MKTAEDRPLYFVNGWVDGFFIGFASLALFVYCRYLQAESIYSDAQLNLAIAMAWMVNWPHIFATYCRLYQSRETRAQYPMTAFLLPAVVATMGAMAFASPDSFAPALVRALMLWSPFHFSGQTIGITLLYAKRSGIEIRPWQRASIVGFCFSSFLAYTTAIESNAATIPFSSISYPLLNVPKEAATVFTGLSFIFLAAIAVGALRILQSGKRLPWIVGLPLLAQYLWFIHGSEVYGFQLFISSLHGLQYLLIAWSMQLSLSAPTRMKNPRSFIIAKSLKWGAVTTAGGAFLFYFIPNGLSRFGWDLAFCNVTILAIFQIHHFFIDGVIWKLRAKSVSDPLMGSLEQLLKRKANF